MSLTNLSWVPAAAFGDPRSPELAAVIAVPQVGGAPPHVAAALAWKAYAWYLVNPVVTALASSAPVPQLDLRNVEVRVTDAVPYVAFRAVDPRPLADDGVVDLVHETLFEGHLRPVAQALSAATRIGVRTLWGSVAEAVSYPLVSSGRTDLADRLLAAWGLDHLLQPALDGGQPFRRTCCLAVTVEGLGVCATCPVRRARPVSEGAA
ncbi:MAG: IucA/IucC family C-terminal-domain containing protein [Nocardioidaceae bacterium]